jgi:hypothetical protein
MSNSQCSSSFPTPLPLLRSEQSLRELELLGHTVRRVAGFSAIDFGRSVLVSQALRDGFDDILFIDSDIGFQPADVDLLASHPEPIVCGLDPKKGLRQSTLAGRFAIIIQTKSE